MPIRNPVLTGFNPDPALLRVGDDYYIATSTFEWFPGVQIYHSRDLMHWRLLCRPLDRVSQIDLKGCDHSCGVWAPCLTHADGLFWLVYTNTRSWRGPFKDCHNYLVTAPDITGPWSDPVYLHGVGFDPSLFHDEDGRKWINAVRWDHRPIQEQSHFTGIVLQEYDHQTGHLVGPETLIWKGDYGTTEGSHIIKRDGWYYLLTAEGGTGPRHRLSLARSRHLHGPYETCPDNPLLTNADHPDARLSRCGHGSLIETPAGEWYVSHLCSRSIVPLGSDKDPGIDVADARSIMGRESGLQRVVWPTGEWPRLATKGHRAQDELPDPAGLEPHPWPAAPVRTPLDGDQLPLDFQTLREPVDDSWLRCTAAGLAIRGRLSLFSQHEQSLVARRVQHPRCRFATRLTFEPSCHRESAGIALYYDRENHYFWHWSRDEHGPYLDLLVADNRRFSQLGLERRIALPGDCDELQLAFRIDGARLSFAYALADEDWHELPDTWDATVCSDEHPGHWPQLSPFTGAFCALVAQDLGYGARWATFRHVDYEGSDD